MTLYFIQVIQIVKRINFGFRRFRGRINETKCETREPLRHCKNSSSTFDAESKREKRP